MMSTSSISLQKDELPFKARVRQYIVAGVIMVLPIVITIWLIDFLSGFIVDAGDPFVRLFAQILRPFVPPLADFLLTSFMRWLLAIIVVVVGIIAVGWAAPKTAGRFIIRKVEDFLMRLPVVRPIYGGVKDILATMEAAESSGVRSAVLVQYPSRDMKTPGFVMSTHVDRDTGRELAAVYIPTTPNPSSGYMQIVPRDRLTLTSWTPGETTKFIATAGTVAPKDMNFDRSHIPPEKPPEEPDSESGDDESSGDGKDSNGPALRRYLVTGIITLLPLWITWFMVRFVVEELLINIGGPFILLIAAILRPFLPTVSSVLTHPWALVVLAVVSVGVTLYLLGVLATRLVWRLAANQFESVVMRIPVISAIYDSAKQFVAVLQRPPEGVRRVVLIDFPHSENKAVAFVTSTIVDDDTGRELATVFAPTTPDPSSGYLQIVPRENLISTPWTVGEGIKFVVTAGIVAPDKINYDVSYPPIAESRPSANVPNDLDEADEAGEVVRSWRANIGRRIVSGILLAIPIWATFLVVKFILNNILVDIGSPFVTVTAGVLRPLTPEVANFIVNQFVRWMLALIGAVVGILAIGWVATRAIGRVMVGQVHDVMMSVPVVERIYGGVLKLIDQMQTGPLSGQSAVLIGFPNSNMKTVGFVTSTQTDPDTGRELATVYIPTTPNPASGNLEILPRERLTATNWSVAEAMKFIVTAGTVKPRKMFYDAGHVRGQPNAPPDLQDELRAANEPEKPSESRLRRYFVAGLLAVMPFVVVWLVVKFVIGLLVGLGGPFVVLVAQVFRPFLPAVAEYLLNPAVKGILAIILVILILYVLGWMTTKVGGRLIIGWLESQLERIPVIKSLYGGAKGFVESLNQKPSEMSRAVLIDFPNAESEMKAPGFVNSTHVDSDTGRSLSVVYVPTTPNPTSGYLQIVPTENIVTTNWTPQETMQFVVSGGTVAPSHMSYQKSITRGD